MLFGWRFGCCRCPLADVEDSEASSAEAGSLLPIPRTPWPRLARRSWSAFSAGEPGAGIRRIT